jgi:hypothetical protein
LVEFAPEFAVDLIDLIEQNRRNSELFRGLLRLKIGQRYGEVRMQKCQVIFCRALRALRFKFALLNIFTFLCILDLFKYFIVPLQDCQTNFPANHTRQPDIRKLKNCLTQCPDLWYALLKVLLEKLPAFFKESP